MTIFRQSLVSITAFFSVGWVEGTVVPSVVSSRSSDSPGVASTLGITTSHLRAISHSHFEGK
jgi:hypothetical protein